MKMKRCLSGNVTTALAAAMISGSVMAAVSVEQRDYLFKMDITRDTSTSTFVIGAFDGTKQPQPPAPLTFAEKNKMRLTIRTREAVAAGE